MKSTISIAEFKNLAKQGRVGKARNGDKAKGEMWEVIHNYAPVLGMPFKEHKFSTRKFKFDFAYLTKKIAIEYEGIGFKGGKVGLKGEVDKSGHTSPTGYTSNCEKYNLATVLG